MRCLRLPETGRRAALSGTAEVPTSLVFTGRLYGESELMAVAHAYQEATGHHLKRPPEATWVPLKDANKAK